MAYPIEIAYTTGSTLYAIVHNPDGTVWNNTLEQWEAFNASHWLDYTISLTEQGSSGYYRGAYPAEISGVLTTEAIYYQSGITPAQGDGPPAGLAQTQGSNMAAIGGNVTAAINMATSGNQMLLGSAMTGTLSVTQATTDLVSTSLVNAYAGRTILWTSGTLAGVAAGITGYSVTGGLITFTPVPTAPSNGDTFIII